MPSNLYRSLQIHNLKYQVGVRCGCGWPPKESWHAEEARLAQARALSEVAAAGSGADWPHYSGGRPLRAAGPPGREGARPGR